MTIETQIKPKKRNRAATEERIIDAFGVVLQRDGVANIGINSVAREAGIQKNLIYRYFTDLPGLALVWINKNPLWPDSDEIMGGDVEAFRALPVEEKIKRTFHNFMEKLRKDPLMLEILTSELLAPNSVAEVLEKAHVRFGTDMEEHIAHDDPNKLKHIPTLIPLIYSCINYLCIRTFNNPKFFQYDLTDQKSWDEIRQVVDRTIDGYLNHNP